MFDVGCLGPGSDPGGPNEHRSALDCQVAGLDRAKVSGGRFEPHRAGGVQIGRQLSADIRSPDAQRLVLAKMMARRNHQPRGG
jgi:hypothetical protein